MDISTKGTLLVVWAFVFLLFLPLYILGAWRAKKRVFDFAQKNGLSFRSKVGTLRMRLGAAGMIGPVIWGKRSGHRTFLFSFTLGNCTWCKGTKMSFVDGTWAEKPLSECLSFLEEGGAAKELAAENFSLAQIPKDIRIMAAVAESFLAQGLEIPFEKAWRIERALMAYRRSKVSLMERISVALGAKKDLFPYSAQETAYAIMAKEGSLESKEVATYLEFRVQK